MQSKVYNSNLVYVRFSSSFIYLFFLVAITNLVHVYI